MNIDKNIASLSLEDLGYDKKLSFDKDMFTFKANDVDTIIFPLKNKLNLRALDQIILTGHYLYGQNEDFRLAYLEAFGKEFSINYKDMREFFTKNVFNILLYGTVVSTYVNNMPENPPYYLHRPKEDERNTSIVDFINSEHDAGRKTHRTEGTPFYSYMLKKTIVVQEAKRDEEISKPKFGISNKRFDTQSITICPIRELVPLMKSGISNIAVLADEVYKLMIDSCQSELKDFAQVFTDQSWSPFIKGI